MRRIETSGRAEDLFGPGRHGFKDGNPLTGDPATVLDAAWFNAIQEEVANAIEGAGLALDPDDRSQLRQAMRRTSASGIFGGIVSSALTITAADHGKMYCLLANTFTVTLPSLDAVPDGFKVTFCKGSAAGVQSVSTSGGAAFVGDETAISLFVLGDVLDLVRHGDCWYPLVAPAQESWPGLVRLAGTDETAAGIETRRAVTPKALLSALATFDIPTRPQFEASQKLATTAFVQRALGNSRGYVGLTASTVLAAEHCGLTIFAGNSSGGMTLTLPAASELSAGARYSIVNTGADDVTIACQGGGGVVLGHASAPTTSVVLKSGDSIVLEALGSGLLWYAVGGSAKLASSGIFARSLTRPGYQKLPGGLILQWGTVAVAGPNVQVTTIYPISFPIGTLLALSCPYSASTMQAVGLSVAGFSATSITTHNSSQQDVAGYYIALGH